MPSLRPRELDFLVNVCELIVTVRRALSYTYACRYFLRGGPNKKQYFDSIQQNLELSALMLHRVNEKENFVNLFDCDERGRLTVGTQFLNYKKTLFTLYHACQTQFNSCMLSILDGIPEAPEDFFLPLDGYRDPKIAWTCLSCKVKSKGTENICKGCKK